MYNFKEVVNAVELKEFLVCPMLWFIKNHNIGQRTVFTMWKQFTKRFLTQVLREHSVISCVAQEKIHDYGIQLNNESWFTDIKQQEYKDFMIKSGIKQVTLLVDFIQNKKVKQVGKLTNIYVPETSFRMQLEVTCVFSHPFSLLYVDSDFGKNMPKHSVLLGDPVCYQLAAVQKQTQANFGIKLEKHIPATVLLLTLDGGVVYNIDKRPLVYRPGYHWRSAYNMMLQVFRNPNASSYCDNACPVQNICANSWREITKRGFVASKGKRKNIDGYIAHRIKRIDKESSDDCEESH